MEEINRYHNKQLLFTTPFILFSVIYSMGSMPNEQDMGIFRQTIQISQ